MTVCCRWSVTLSGVLLVASLPPLAAQRAPSMRAGAQLATTAERAGGRWSASPRAAAELRLDRSWLGIAGAASLAGGGAEGWRARGDGLLMVATPSRAGWRGSLTGERQAASAALDAALERLDARVGYAATQTGFWISGEVSRAGRPARTAVGDTAATITTTGQAGRVATTFGTGVWRQIAGTLVSVRVSSHAARLGARAARADSVVERRVVTDTGTHVWFERVREGDAGSAGARMRWAESEVRVAWSGNRAMADALVGARPAIGTVQRGAAWAEVGGAARLRGSVWIAGAAGLTPSRPDLGITHRRFARLGLQLTPGVPLRPRRAPEPRAAPAAFTLREAGQGAYVVSLRLPQARLVEIAGDFSGWRPVALAQVAPDRWETVIRLAPGAHRVSLRVDGDRWMAPPGSTSVEDDFGGSAGIVVAR